MENTLLTADRINVIANYAKVVPAGAFAECGVYKGGIVKMLALIGPKRNVYGFDTFEGLPIEHWNENEKHKPKDFDDVTYDGVKSYINLDNVKLIKGLFPDSAKELEDERFAFVHVDFDFYEGTKAALDWFWPRMVAGGIMVFDDYEWQACPGVKIALDQFPHAKAFKTTYMQAAMVKF